MRGTSTTFCKKRADELAFRVLNGKCSGLLAISKVTPARLARRERGIRQIKVEEEEVWCRIRHLKRE